MQPVTIDVPPDDKHVEPKEDPPASFPEPDVRRKRRWHPAWLCVAVLVLIAFPLFIVWIYWRPPVVYIPKRNVMIINSDSREPYIPDNPTEPLDFYTLTAMHNHLYAKSIGAKFVYNVLDSPYDGDIRPTEAGRGVKEAYCHHRRYGWRPASFCRVPVIWNTFRSNPETDYVVYVDSDVVFKSPNTSVHRYLDHLSVASPLGLIANHPYDHEPCVGMLFFYRGRDQADLKTGARQDAAVTFLNEWWNEDWGDVHYGHMEEQATLRHMTGYGIYGTENTDPIPERKSLRHKIIFLEDEWQFEDHDPDQVVVHMNHWRTNRFGRLAKYWKWPDYPLEDRDKLRKLLKQVDIRKVDPNKIADQMWEHHKEEVPRQLLSRAVVPK